ncbi:MAG TPA: NAD-dependent epimerase/dehydratase family protein [Kofleriaceae bacterium]
MTTTRRDFLVGSAALGLLACGPKPAPAVTQTVATKKRILILGGTSFLGPKTIEAALARGHEVTTFNRGKREKLQPLAMKVERLYGNRDPELPAEDDKGPDGKLLHPEAQPMGLEQLVGKHWDAVIDTSGFFPRHVKASAELLAKQGVTQYIYISSISCYDDSAIPATGGDEHTKLATLKDPTVETMGDQFENYGALKALCEQAVSAAFPNGATNVRPGYIVGPGDPTDRFTYWPVRAMAGGDMIAPGTPADPIQWIDVRDLGAWLVHLVEAGTPGTFNAVTPTGKWGSVLDACVRAGGGTKLVWIPNDWLEVNKMAGDDAGRDQFQIWNAPVGKYAGFHRWSNARATGAGLTFRPIDDTVSALRAWWPDESTRRIRVTKELADQGKKVPPGDPGALRAGPTREKEQELLAKFRG